jgi:hypothetical protein
VTEAQLRAFVDSWLDNAAFCRESLTINDKNGRLVKLHHTPAQAALNAKIQQQERRAKPVRGIILKARRVHISVAICAQAFHRVAFFNNMHGLLASHLDESAGANYEYIKHFDKAYREGPGYLGVSLPKVTTSNAEGMAWANGSDIRIATAGNVDFSRGGTSFQFAHLTEFAFWRNAEATMRGLGQSVPSLPGTYEFIESSANGKGGLFHELWQDAQRRDSDRFALFFAWWEHPEYRMRPEDPARFQDSLKPEELAIQRQYHLDIDQLYWRRWAIANQCQRSEDTFHQEYPSCPEEAFLTSGRPRFDVISISRQPVMRQPIAGSLTMETVGLAKRVCFDSREDGRGELEIWKQPDRGRNYVIGADVAQGIDVSAKQGGASDPDYSCACVLDAGTGEQVAAFRERWTPGRFAEFLYLLGHFYNAAYIIPERNRDGTAVIESLKDRLRYPIERLWVDTGRLPHDRRAPLLEEIGWLTTVTSKPQLIHALDEALRTRAITVHKGNTIAELYAFVVKPDGRVEGQGAHDDEVIALALAVQGLMRAPEIFANPIALRAQIDAEEAAELERYGAPHRRPGWRGPGGNSRM